MDGCCRCPTVTKPCPPSCCHSVLEFAGGKVLIAFWDTNPSQEEYNYGCFAGFQGGLSTQACADVGFEAPASHQRALLIPGAVLCAAPAVAAGWTATASVCCPLHIQQDWVNNQVWLRKALNRSTADWKLIVGHHPPHCSGAWVTNLQGVDAGMQEAACLVDIAA